MVDNSNERLPLLGEAPESSNSNQQDVKNNSDNLINFSTQNVDGRSFISCKVCGNQIDITDKTDTYVVKCQKCGEATPIKRAPSKKRYVRCSCNCLLICCETANRIVCPRGNCKKIIELPSVKKRRLDEEIQQQRLPPQFNSPQPSDDFNCYINCGHCSHRFMFSVLSNKLAKCPSCKRTSSIGHSYANTRGIIFMILFIIFVTIAINLSVTSKSSYSIAISIALYLVSIVLLGRSIYFFTLKVSEISTTNSIA